MRRGDDHRITNREVVSDFLSAVVGVVTLNSDSGELTDDFRKSKVPPQRSSRAFLNNLCLLRVHSFSFVQVVRDVLREKKERLETAQIRDAILDGYRDAIQERTHDCRS